MHATAVLEAPVVEDTGVDIRTQFQSLLQATGVLISKLCLFAYENNIYRQSASDIRENATSTIKDITDLTLMAADQNAHRLNRGGSSTDWEHTRVIYERRGLFHVMTGDDSLSAGLRVVEADLFTALENTSFELRALLKNNHGIDADVHLAAAILDVKLAREGTALLYAIAI